MVAPGRQDRTAVPREELNLLLTDHVVPSHPDVGRSTEGHRVVDAQCERGRAHAAHRCSRPAPPGHRRYSRCRPLARPVTSLNCASMVWRLLNSEMFPILTASPASRTRHTTAKRVNLKADFGKCRKQPHGKPPENLRDDAAEVRSTWTGSGCPIMPYAWLAAAAAALLAPEVAEAVGCGVGAVAARRTALERIERRELRANS